MEFLLEVINGILAVIVKEKSSIVGIEGSEAYALAGISAAIFFYVLRFAYDVARRNRFIDWRHKTTGRWREILTIDGKEMETSVHISYNRRLEKFHVSGECIEKETGKLWSTFSSSAVDFIEEHREMYYIYTSKTHRSDDKIGETIGWCFCGFSAEPLVGYRYSRARGYYQDRLTSDKRQQYEMTRVSKRNPLSAFLSSSSARMPLA